MEGTDDGAEGEEYDRTGIVSVPWPISGRCAEVEVKVVAVKSNKGRAPRMVSRISIFLRVFEIF